jgi:hypothetical protein
MTKKEKEKFFNGKNNSFKKSLDRTPQRKSKCQKHVHFKENFSYKPFVGEQKVS